MSQPSVSCHQAVIEGGGGRVSHAGLHIAVSTNRRSMVLFPLPTTFICIYYRENLRDLPVRLTLRDGTF